MYIKFLPSEYVLRYRKGKLVKEGKGLSFFFLERNTAACAIPVSEMDTDFIFEEPTGDFQHVAVQGQLTYRVADYHRIAEATDFTVNLKTKEYHDTPLKKLSKRMTNIAEVIVKRELAEIELTQAVQSGQQLADSVLDSLRKGDTLKQLGIEVTGFSVLNIAPSTETTRALEAQTREEILRQADDALYERRNASIEQERRVKENELNTEISVEEKKKHIRETEISTKRMLVEKENELEKIKTQSEAQRKKIRLDAELELEKVKTESETQRKQICLDAEIELEKKRRELAGLRLENAKKDADAEAYRISVVMEAYNKLSKEVLVALATLNTAPEMLIAQAFDKLAAGEGKIGTLNISPDFLESLKTGVRQ